VLTDGTPIVLRHIRASDGDQLRDAFLQLSPESRYRRFFHSIGRLTDEMVRYLSDVDGVDHVAIVAGLVLPDGHEQGMGVARFVRLKDEPTVAEMAVTVLDEHQGKGLGNLLLLAAARAAHERGIDHFRGEVLRENAPMRALLSTLDAKVIDDDGDSIVFDIALEPLLGPDRESSGAAHLLREAAAAVLRFVERQVGKKMAQTPEEP
jgi:GNAT superfamily N-acetyltransferase